MVDGAALPSGPLTAPVVGSSASRAKRSLRVRSLAVALSTASLGLISVFAVATPAVADPPLTVAEAKAQIEQLETEAEAIDQEYVAVKEQLDKGSSELERKRAELQAQSDRVAAMKKQVGQVALAQFQNRSLDTAAQLFVTPNTEEFLSQVSTVEKVTENQNSVLQDYQQQQAALDTLERSAKTDLALLTTQEQKLGALRTQSERKITESKAVLAKLTEEEQRQIQEEERRATAQANAAGDRAVEPAPGDTTDIPAGSGRGAKAMAFAKAQIGKPYRFAAAGPNAYDCSGLTSAAWRAAGVTLPRTSQAQFRVGRAVSRSELQPGDLVFFYSGLSHVGLYAGNGMLLHSPRPGKTVQYVPVSSMPYAGARRPG